MGFKSVCTEASSLVLPVQIVILKCIFVTLHNIPHFNKMAVLPVDFYGTKWWWSQQDCAETSGTAARGFSVFY